MIFQCSNCGNEFELEEVDIHECPYCKVDRTYLVAQPFNVLSELESHHDMGDEHIFED
jgi:Zn finger protein HypA/HybF involved in hydrogenase expression